MPWVSRKPPKPTSRASRSDPFRFGCPEAPKTSQEQTTWEAPPGRPFTPGCQAAGVTDLTRSPSPEGRLRPLECQSLRLLKAGQLGELEDELLQTGTGIPHVFVEMLME